MNKLGRLIKNELFKKFKQKSTIVLIIIFALFSFALPFLIKITTAEFGDYYRNYIKYRIDNLEQKLNTVREWEDKTDIVAGQLEARLEVLNSAKEMGILAIYDWRNSVISVIDSAVGAQYEVKLILENKVDPENYFGDMVDGLMNSSQLLGKERPSDQELQKLLDDYDAQIEKYWNIIESDDYNSYNKMMLSQLEEKKAKFDSEMAEKNISTEDLPADQRAEYYYLDAELTVYKYCVENSVVTEKWQMTTLDRIKKSYSEIVELEDRLNALKNSDQETEFIYPGGTLEEEIEFIEERIETYEEKNLIYLESIKNGTPTYYEADAARLKILDNFQFTILAAIIAVFIASNIVSGEFSHKTINMLVIRPVKRWKIIFAKYVSILITAYVLYFAGWIASILSNGINFGFSDYVYPYMFVSGGAVHSINFFLYLLAGIMFSSITIVFFVTISFMMSTLVKNTALAGITSVGVFIGGNIIYNIILASVKNSRDILKYTFIPYMDLSQSGRRIFEIKDGMEIYGAVHLLVLSIILFAVSLTIFTRRDIKQ